MEEVKYVFCILTYRNTEDIKECIESIKKSVSCYKIIIINSFYDNKSMVKFKIISEKNNCVFINIENRGYGYGNNRGVEFALNHYKFEYLIIANPDTVIEEFSERILGKVESAVIGPEIINLKGKFQNPMLVTDFKIAQYLIFFGLKSNKNFYIKLGQLINKLYRILFLLLKKMNKRDYYEVYQIHGSFLLFHYDVLKKIGLPYDENMFLFAEEGYLAYKLKQNKIKSYCCDKIKVLHKEDGSMNFRDDVNEKLRQSNLYFFDTYYCNKEK